MSKTFGATPAVDNVDLSVSRGSVHALIGENGAGKSTLGKIIAGVHPPDSGTYLLGGTEVSFRSPGQALHHGVTMISQELALIPTGSVIDNTYLGIEDQIGPLLDRRRTKARFAELIEATGFALPPNAIVASLSVAQQQQVEILRAVAREASLIVMDEPTARLSMGEAEALHGIVRSLAARGTTIIFVSHFLDEVLSLSDAVTVLRDGRLVKTVPTSSETPQSLVLSMVGHAVAADRHVRPVRAVQTAEVLSVEGLSRAGAFHDVSLVVHQGEIVGLAGQVGSGRSEVARAIFGADPLERGTVRVDGREIEHPSVPTMMEAGIAMVPESRTTQGLLVGRPVRENLTLRYLARLSRAGVVLRRAESRRSSDLADEFGIKRASIEQPISQLSGGNQQKVLFARWLMERPKLLIADEPTSGVDIGAKRAIHEVLSQLAADGVGVLLISSEVEEILGLADRVLVMRKGRIVAEFSADSGTERSVIAAAFGAANQTEGSQRALC